MTKQTKLKTILSILAMVTLNYGILLWPLSVQSQIVQAKVDLSLLSGDQQQQFWSMVDLYVKMDAFSRFCGHDVHFEERIASAAQNCVKAEAIMAVRAVYRRKLAAFTRTIPAGVCQRPTIPRIIAKNDELLSFAVGEVDRACRACLICNGGI